MNRGFDQEFYRSEWQRVLPLGPDGIQPYVRLSRPSRRLGLRPALARLIATWGAMAQGVIAFGRVAPLGMARPPMLLATAPRPERPRRSLHLAPGAARPTSRGAAAMQRRSRAA